MSLIKFKATINDEGRSLFKFLVKSLNNIPISRVEKLFRLKDIKVNGIKLNDKAYKLKLNDEIIVYGLKNEFKENLIQKININFKIIFEDENILVIEKPINVVIHGANDSLDNQVLSYLAYKKIDSFQPSHIGRLDKTTSGIMIYAKNYKTLVEFNKKNKYFEKYYELKSDFPWDKKHVVFYSFYNKDKKNVEITNKPVGSKMETIFFKHGNKKYAQIVTGKKHQIRLSLSKLNYPIKGDIRYGGAYAKRVFLHCCRVSLHNLKDGLEYLNDISFYSDPKW